MPLYIADDTSPYIYPVNDVGRFLRQYPSLVSSAATLKSQAEEKVEGAGVLYVNQREYAILNKDDASFTTVGTDNATTCHMFVLRHTGSGALGLAHCDGSDMTGGINRMIDAVMALSASATSGQLEVRLAGGFIDSRNISDGLTKDIIAILQSQVQDIYLKLACITDLNDVLQDDLHFPVVYGIKVDVATGDIFRASFPGKSPSIPLRAAPHFAGMKTMINVYDRETHEVVVGPFWWQPEVTVTDKSGEPRSLSYLIGLSDEQMRDDLSTSPVQEREDFSKDCKAALRVLEQNSYPDLSFFPGNNAIRYAQDSDGTWTVVEKPTPSNTNMVQQQQRRF